MRQYVFLGLATATAALSACATKPAVVHNIGSMTPERISPGLLRRYITADQSSMAIYDLRRGAKVPVHTHGSEQLSYVQQGRLRFIVGGQSHDLRAGQVIVIPANAPHSIEALENSVEYDFFAPARGDWAKDRDEQDGAGAAQTPTGPPGSRLP
jgi:quercetin dioxygenase-like cupin family protein